MPTGKRERHDTDRIRTSDGWSIQCVQCGRWFESKRSDASFCRDGCRRAYMLAPKRLKAQIEETERYLDALLNKPLRSAKQPQYEALMRMGRKIANALNNVES